MVGHCQTAPPLMGVAALPGRHPRRRLVPPNQRESGTVADPGDLVGISACRLAAAWPGMGVAAASALASRAGAERGAGLPPAAHQPDRGGVAGWACPLPTGVSPPSTYPAGHHALVPRPLSLPSGGRHGTFASGASVGAVYRGVAAGLA